MPPVEVAPDNEDKLPEEAAAGALVVADEVGKALSTIVNTNTTITAAVARARELHQQYKDVAFDCETTVGMEQARKAREALREEGRYVVQRLKDTGSKMLGTMQRQFNSACEKYVAEIEAYEKPIHDQIKAVEDRKEREKEEKRAKEEARRQGHANAIAAIASLASQAAGMTSAELEEHIVRVQAVIVDESYEEFQAQAAQAKDKALLELNGMLMAARLDEQERAEMEAERARMAQVREAQAARERELAEREAALARAQAEQVAEAQRLAAEAAAQQRAIEERARAVIRRIQEMVSHYGEERYTAAVPSVRIESAIATLKDTLILPGDFDDKVPEAEKAKEGLLEFLQVTLKLSLEREAEEARLEQERAAREVVPTLELFGEEMLPAAQEAYTAAEAELYRALAVAQEREAEQERQREQERAAQAAAQALQAAKLANADEMYQALHAFACISLGFADGALSGEIKAVRALLMRINPNELFGD